jgi:hypothetical protein
MATGLKSQFNASRLRLALLAAELAAVVKEAKDGREVTDDDVDRAAELLAAVRNLPRLV